MKITATIVAALGIARIAWGVLAVRARAMRRDDSAAAPGPRGFVTVGGVRLHYTERGFGTPVVIVRSDPSDDAPVLLDRIAADGLRAIALDGPARTAVDDAHHSHDGAAAEARRIHAAAEALGAHRPILVARGDAAEVAYRYALDFPGDAAGLLILVPRSRVPRAVALGSEARGAFGSEAKDAFGSGRGADPVRHTRVREPVIVLKEPPDRPAHPDRIAHAVRELVARSRDRPRASTR